MLNLSLLAIAFLASTIGSICGVGGGVIIKPVLDAVSGLDIAVINFLSGCTVLCMTAYSVTRSKLSGSSRLELHTGIPLALGASVGGILGKLLFQLLRSGASDPDRVSAIQSLCLFLMTAATLLYTINKEKIRTHRIENRSICLIVGFLLGLMSSFLGIGGGPINLVVLFYFFSMDTKTAAENSLYIILFSQIASLLYSLFTKTVPVFPVDALCLMAAGGIGGGMLGRSITKKISNRVVDKLFIALISVIILICIYNFSRYI